MTTRSSFPLFATVTQAPITARPIATLWITSIIRDNRKQSSCYRKWQATTIRRCSFSSCKLSLSNRTETYYRMVVFFVVDATTTLRLYWNGIQENRMRKRHILNPHKILCQINIKSTLKLYTGIILQSFFDQINSIYIWFALCAFESLLSLCAFRVSLQRTIVNCVLSLRFCSFFWLLWFHFLSPLLIRSMLRHPFLFTSSFIFAVVVVIVADFNSLWFCVHSIAVRIVRIKQTFCVIEHNNFD